MNGKFGVGASETFPRQVMHSKFGEIAHMDPHAAAGYPADSLKASDVSPRPCVGQELAWSSGAVWFPLIIC